MNGTKITANGMPYIAIKVSPVQQCSMCEFDVGMNIAECPKNEKHNLLCVNIPGDDSADYILVSDTPEAIAEYIARRMGV